jgi:Ca2+-binding EF-hand superfamily protein
LNLPELIGERICNQINANGDERIDHDEWIRFFLKLLMGPLEQKMHIAFLCFDVDNNEKITEDEIKIVMMNIP